MLIHDDSMAIIFNTPIAFNTGEEFRFGSLFCIADHKGILHRITDPSEKTSSPMAPITKESLPLLTSVLRRTLRREDLNQLSSHEGLLTRRAGLGP
jgi:hypothetical protein